MVPAAGSLPDAGPSGDSDPGAGMLRPLPLFCCLALALPACERAPAPELRIGINPWPGYEHFYLAQELGLYDTTLVRVRVVELSSLSDTRRAFERGQLDAFASTLVEVLAARSNSARRPRVVLVTDYSNGADVVIGGPGVRSLAGLRGRRVGVEPATLNVYLLSRALEGVGLSLDDVTLVPVNLLQMPPALREHRVDAVVTYPPASVSILQQPGMTVLFSSASLPGEIIDVASVDSGFLLDHPQAAAELLRGFEAARHYAGTHPEDAVARMAARERLSPEDFAATVAGGLAVVPLASQAEFLGQDGTVAQVLPRLGATLHAIGELPQVPLGSGLVAPEVAAAAIAGTRPGSVP